MMPEDFFSKNMEMWDRFTSTYMENMFKMVDKTIGQSKAFQDRVNQAAAEAVSAQLDASLQALKTLQEQVEALSAKVDQLVKK